MNSSPSSRPVLLTMHTRLDTTRRVLEAISQARPERLYLACDGPRTDRPGEAELVSTLREEVLSSIDWDCEVKTLFRDQNLGCRGAISGALDWFFSQEDAGIVLEDDCVPGPDFFRFCDEMLDRFAEDDRVAHISGACLVDFSPRTESFYYSRYPLVWGWATWSRAWQSFSMEPPSPDQIESIAQDFGSPAERRHWSSLLKKFYEGEIDTWDYAWTTSIWLNGGVSISSTRNLVTNIGFGSSSTHTKSWKDFRGLGNRPIEDLGPLVPPASEAVDDELDRRLFRGAYERPPAPVLAARLLRQFARR